MKNGDLKKLTPDEQKRLSELLALKKSGKLDDAAKTELEALNAKMGFKPGKPGTPGGFKPGNDFSWWNKFPALTRDVANYKCDYVAGLPIADNDIPFVVPGVLRVLLKSVYGSSIQPTDPINEWAREIYLRMFQRFRVPNSYTASDLGICIIACIEVVKLTAKYERIYGVINRYSKRNMNKPFAEARALGLSMADINYLQSHLSQFRSDLNALIIREQKISVPKDISLIADSLSLMGYEYLDHEGDRSQIIIFDVDDIGLYSDTDLSTGGSIKFENVGDTPLFDFNADNMCKLLQVAVDAIVGSDSLQRIMADLVTWFGEDAMLKFNPIDETLISVPEYSESVLHKLHNLETVSSGSAIMRSWVDNLLPTADANKVCLTHYIYQVDDRIITQVGFVDYGTGVSVPYKNGTFLACPDTMDRINSIQKCHMIDTYRVDVTEETVIEGAMWKFASEYVADAAANAVLAITSCSFWIADSMTYYGPNGLVAGPLFNVKRNDADAMAKTGGRLALIDWAPITYNINGTKGSFYIEALYGDVDNIIPIYNAGLYKIHRVVQLSGLYSDVSVVNK